MAWVEEERVDVPVVQPASKPIHVVVDFERHRPAETRDGHLRRFRIPDPGPREIFGKLLLFRIGAIQRRSDLVFERQHRPPAILLVLDVAGIQLDIKGSRKLLGDVPSSVEKLK